MPVFGDLVAIGDNSGLRAAPVDAVLAGSRPLVDGLLLELREGGEHLEDEPSCRRGGVNGLGGTPQGGAGLLEPVVGIYDDHK